MNGELFDLVMNRLTRQEGQVMNDTLAAGLLADLVALAMALCLGKQGHRITKLSRIWGDLMVSLSYWISSDVVS
jgi:hypothetical protein